MLEGKKRLRVWKFFDPSFHFFRSILKVLGGGEQRIRDKLDTDIPKPPRPSIAILQISDGSCVASLQGKQIIELKAEKILHIGTVDQDRYPLMKKSLPLENLRGSVHLRPRTTTVSSVMRIRNALIQATHTFFQENGFLYVQVPIITRTDSEGIGENFQVVTTLSDKGKIKNQRYSGECWRCQT